MTEPGIILFHVLLLMFLIAGGLAIYYHDLARRYKRRCGELIIEKCKMRERAEIAEGSPHQKPWKPAAVVRLRPPTDASCKICGGNCGQCGGPLG